MTGALKQGLRFRVCGFARFKCASQSRALGKDPAYGSWWLCWRGSGHSSRHVPAADVLELGVVLAEKVSAVVVAVGGSNDGVDVEACRLVAVEGDAWLVVELDEYYRALDSVVEHVVVTRSTHPHEMCVIEVLAEGLQPLFGMSLPQPPGVQAG